MKQIIHQKMNINTLYRFSWVMIILAMFTFSNQVFAIEPPSDVTEVKATLGEQGEVVLTWNEAESEEGVIIGYKVYYGTTSVQTKNDVYEDEIEISADTTYVISGLPSGQTYYLAVTALDDELNESNNYSEEVSIDLPLQENLSGEDYPEENTPKEVIEEQGNMNEENFPEEKVITSPEDNHYEDPLANDNNFIEEETHSAPIDNTPPAEVSSLVVDKSTIKSQKSVSIKWQKSANLDGDVVDQIFYSKKGSGDWDNGYSIGKSLEEMVFDVQENTDYQVKIVTVDSNGNKSVGRTISFSTETLSSSGPTGMLTIIIAMLTMLLFTILRKKS